MVDPNILPPTLRAFYEFWERKRAGRHFPHRADMRFEELRPWLGEIHLVEVLPDDFRYKVFATKSAERLGQEYTGVLLSNGLPPDMARDAAVDYRRAVDEAAPHYAD